MSTTETYCKVEGLRYGKEIQRAFTAPFPLSLLSNPSFPTSFLFHKGGGGRKDRIGQINLVFGFILLFLLLKYQIISICTAFIGMCMHYGGHN